MASKIWSFSWLGVFIAVLAVACSPQGQAYQEAVNKAAQRRPYIQQNNIEFDNYDRRQKITDDPTIIQWCTSAFSVPGSPIFTVPVVGKLTSGNKRPFSSEPGPDGMYGSSGEYRFGFTPGGNYADWYNLETFCTTEPTVWQKERTEIVLQTDAALFEAQKRAQQALQNNKPEEANKILEEAIRNSQGRR